MKLYTTWDEAALRAIAKDCDNPQVVRDVGYGRAANYHNPRRMYCERTDDAFLIGTWQKDALRIIGMGTRVKARRHGWGGVLLKRAIDAAREKGCTRVWTRTLSGADFYAKRGWDIIGKRGTDYLMEFRLTE